MNINFILSLKINTNNYSLKYNFNIQDYLFFQLKHKAYIFLIILFIIYYMIKNNNLLLLA